MRPDQKSSGVFFVHVMKSCGISLNRQLQAAVSAENSYPRPGAGPTGHKVMVHLLEKHCDSEPARFVTVHMAAWTAAAFAPEHLHVTVLREPVARTVSHLRQIARSSYGPDTAEAVWAEADFRVRLTDYQTRLFSLEQHAPAPDLGNAKPEDFATSMRVFRLTAMSGVGPVTEEDFERARARLEQFDVVGVTERLQSFADRLASRAELELGEIGRENAAPASEPLPAEILDEIVEATSFDRRLHERAQELSV
ncbi:MAG: hypothetical protein ACI9C1_000623 [Candidatus Aldehydirespiratoraceae bacterium]|jgi:hypothetical protein